mmetsp:Transcript_72447/g.151198  ORF Transcript_72447/g.151198 Transcript_72447/m.151198 type:complete len:269 (-) Transcript_72447:216-1022(-)
MQRCQLVGVAHLVAVFNKIDVELHTLPGVDRSVCVALHRVVVELVSVSNVECSAHDDVHGSALFLTLPICFHELVESFQSQHPVRAASAEEEGSQPRLIVQDGLHDLHVDGRLAQKLSVNVAKLRALGLLPYHRGVARLHWFVEKCSSRERALELPICVWGVPRVAVASTSEVVGLNAMDLHLLAEVNFNLDQFPVFCAYALVWSIWVEVQSFHRAFREIRLGRQFASQPDDLVDTDLCLQPLLHDLKLQFRITCHCQHSSSTVTSLL